MMNIALIIAIILTIIAVAWTKKQSKTAYQDKGFIAPEGIIVLIMIWVMFFGYMASHVICTGKWW